MALKAHNSVKLGVRPSFCWIIPNSSAVSRSCSAVFTLISMLFLEIEKPPASRRKSTNPVAILSTLFPIFILQHQYEITRFASYGFKTKDCFCSEYQLEYLQIQALPY